MAFATAFEIDDLTSFVGARTTNIAHDLLVSKCSVKSVLPVVCGSYVFTKFVLRNLMSVEYFESFAAFTFRVTNLDENTLASCSESTVVLLLNRNRRTRRISPGRKMSCPIGLFHLRRICTSRRCVCYSVPSGP